MPKASPFCPFPPAAPMTYELLAHNGADYALNTLASYSFSVNQPTWMGYIYTDRPVYRPGHTVHFKGILRLKTAAGYEVPAGKAVSVSIQDQEQKPVYQKTLTTSANGAIHDELTLAPSASLGSYFIEVKPTAGEGYMNGSFGVEEYKKPEYEVRVIPGKARVLQGETVEAAIDARYYFGEPVSGAKVHYAVYRDRYWFPLWYDPDESTSEDVAGGDNDDTGDQVAEGDGELDADGKLTINVEHHGLRAQSRLPVSRRRPRHRSGQPRDHRPRLDRRHLRQLCPQRHARSLLLCARRPAATVTVEVARLR